VKAILAAGGRVLVWGQSAMSRGFGATDLARGVGLALPAMTALVAFQQEGYSLSAFC